MGSRFRKAYTVLGDSVNLASRLEGLTKEYGVGIIVGENTAHSVPEFAWREIDRVRVVGKAASVTIYEPLGPAANPEVVAELALHGQALASYRQRDFEAAETAFAALAAAHPANALYAYFRTRCAAFRSSPPPATWEGSAVFATK